MSEHDSVWPLFRAQSEHETAATGIADKALAPSAGQMLRAAREGAGLHTVALAAALKVSVHRIQKIEADELQTEQDIVFTRALIGSICRHLKIDPRPILDALPLGRPVVLADAHSEGLQTPFHAPGQVASGWVRSLKRPSVWLVALLLLGSAAVLLWPEGTHKTELAPSTVVESPASEAQAQGTAGLAPSIPTPSTNAATVLTPVASNIGTSTPTSAPVSVPAPAPSAAPTLAPTATAAASAEAGLSLKARGNTWIEVQDGKANVLLRRTVLAGETVDLKGLSPLAVVLGRADQVEVLVQGRPLDLKPHTHDNVARFEVRP